MKTLVNTQHAPGGHTSGDTLSIGTQAGPWLIERELGRGGMGVVYAVKHATIGKRAALKVMRHDSQSLDVNASRMQLEAQVVNAIRHPNIVDIFDVGITDDGRSYIVMELLTGRSLKDCEPELESQRPAVAIGDAIEILRQVSGALIAAHSAGVVHRDLKPENIFVADPISGVPRVVVLDWGIARMVNSTTHHTLEGQLVGTPQYIAPEQARGEVVTAKTDVYALGVVAYELVLSQLPFDAESGAEMMAMHLLVPAPPPSLIWPEIPPRLGRLLEQMLAKLPEDRPTMTEVEACLAEISAELRDERLESQGSEPRVTTEGASVARREPSIAAARAETELPKSNPPAARELPDGQSEESAPHPDQLKSVHPPIRRIRGALIGALALSVIAAVIAIASRRAQPVSTTQPPFAQPSQPHVQQAPALSGPGVQPAQVPAQRRTKASLAFANPVLEDCSDPAVLRQAERWYMTCTGGHAGNLYPIYESSDLQSWQRVGWIFPAGHKPEWAAGNYWSPELHPTPDGMAAYFSMRVAGGRNAIGVATAKTIAGPYTDLGTPLVAPPHGASDAHVLVDGGRRYLYFKDEAHPSSIEVQPLATNGVTLEGEPKRVLVATRRWEHDNVEAPWVVHVGGYFYLFYTGSVYCDLSYAIGVARAKTPLGPFEKFPQPIVIGDTDWLAPGHTSVTEGPTGEYYLLYHAYQAAEGEPSCEATSEHNTHRHAEIERLTFENGWPRVSARP